MAVSQLNQQRLDPEHRVHRGLECQAQCYLPLPSAHPRDLSEACLALPGTQVLLAGLGPYRLLTFPEDLFANCTHSVK